MLGCGHGSLRKWTPSLPHWDYNPARKTICKEWQTGACNCNFSKNYKGETRLLWQKNRRNSFELGGFRSFGKWHWRRFWKKMWKLAEKMVWTKAVTGVNQMGIWIYIWSTTELYDGLDVEFIEQTKVAQIVSLSLRVDGGRTGKKQFCEERAIVRKNCSVLLIFELSERIPSNTMK